MRATPEQLKELLELKDGFKCLDIDGVFWITHESGERVHFIKTPAVALRHIRMLRRLHRIIDERSYQRGHDDGRAEGNKVIGEILNA